MIPYSRATPPIEYSLRVSCPFAPQFSMPSGSSEDIEVDGWRCKLSVENEGLLVQLQGLPDVEAAHGKFRKLRHILARISLERRVAIQIPVAAREAQVSDVRFMEDDRRCIERGWPDGARGPVRMIGSDGAWIYPEHECVAIDGAIRLNMPVLSGDLSAVVQGVRDELNDTHESENLDDRTFAAVAAHAHASRSTQHVWRFLLLVMHLEALASPAEASEKVRKAARQLKQSIRTECGYSADLDTQNALCAALDMAGKESITAAVQRLIREHCAPGVAPRPLPSLFIDAADCDAKVRAMYTLRSQYTHTGGVPSPERLKGYDFSTLANVAGASLGHILRIRLGVPVN